MRTPSRRTSRHLLVPPTWGMLARVRSAGYSKSSARMLRMHAATKAWLQVQHKTLCMFQRLPRRGLCWFHSILVCCVSLLLTPVHWPLKKPKQSWSPFPRLCQVRTGRGGPTTRKWKRKRQDDDYGGALTLLPPMLI